ncbi:hypothetical protein KL918_000562 [Ogataea parapolymorpha]|uniref:RNA exonuclease 1 n=1 Tax=Ogataea parapolymorpha (strain ATCC 26012 / BCRC 20466 / JCM 22074 / NRRL Y-7560 / DL-1) TaxID=871575 RepID=W1Q863_OGAPD|nr:RNA exonuclease 1 [Ogataea parapolymorpha DL-1]ESW96604.1 RNA exonuclease 1 [Ogataea parapolymorpha DL-1]KAG7870358.1 hypothetical protein KL918_000562 [Ogataea parapolymorpha]KAG7875307.1 hypothetical protein KL916_000919 [Ogataea parapolymorpha]
MVDAEVSSDMGKVSVEANRQSSVGAVLEEGISVKPIVEHTKRRRSSHQSIKPRFKKSARKTPIFKLKFDSKRKNPLKYVNIRELILYALTDVNKLNFGELENRKFINKVVLVLADGLTAADFGYESLAGLVEEQEIKNTEKYPFISQEFAKFIPLLSPGANRNLFSCATTLSSSTVPEKHRPALIKELELKGVQLSELTIDYTQMVANGYPIHPDVPGATKESIAQYSAFLATKDLKSEPKILALDCEMCLTASGSVVTRVALTDKDHKLVIGDFVKPDEEITDYKTQYSGVDEDSLKGVTTTLHDIQQKLLATISSKDYLIGHSLESDLCALKISHPTIIDTSICFDHVKGPPLKPSLRNLASEILGKSIQQSAHGHDPIEDCVTCMELVQLKLKKGLAFGKLITEESIFRRISHTNKQVLIDGKKIPKSGVAINFGGNKFFNEQRFDVPTDEEAVQKLAENLSNHELAMIKLREPDKFDLSVKYIYETMPSDSLLIVCAGHGDRKRIDELITLQRNISGPLSPEDHQELISCVAKARESLALIKIKP